MPRISHDQPSWDHKVMFSLYILKMQDLNTSQKRKRGLSFDNPLYFSRFFYNILKCLNADIIICSFSGVQFGTLCPSVPLL